MRETTTIIETVGVHREQNWVGTEQQFKVLWWLLSVTLILNVIDAMFTLNWIQRGQAQEANPLMEIIVSSPILFVCVKTALVNFGCYLLWKRHRRPIAVIGIIAAFLAYYAVLLHHLRAVRFEAITSAIAAL